MQKNILVILETAGRAGRAQLIGILRQINEARLDWKLRIVSSRQEMSSAILRRMLTKSVDGVILAIPGGQNVPEHLLRTRLPVVFLDVFPQRQNAALARKAFLRIDDAVIGRTAARHFLSLGNFRSFAFVHYPRPEIWTTTRCASFVDELKSVGKACAVFTPAPATDKTCAVPTTSPAESARLADFLSALPRPAAVLAASDLVGKMVLQTCSGAGLQVPDDIALLSVDNDETLCSQTRPTLSSIEPDFEEEGLRATAELARLLEGRRPRLQITTATSRARLVERESTKPIPPATRLVERALAFIGANYTRPIGVADVVRHLGVSRRLVDLRFRQLQRESILEAITRLRLDELRRRLLESNEPIGKLVRACGFGSVVRATHLFKARYGISMSRFRDTDYFSSRHDSLP